MSRNKPIQQGVRVKIAQGFRHRINTPSLRGVNVQRLFGSQRALKTV